MEEEEAEEEEEEEEDGEEAAAPGLVQARSQTVSGALLVSRDVVGGW